MDDINLEFVEIMGSTVRPIPVVVRGHPGNTPGFLSLLYLSFLRRECDGIDIIANPTKTAALLPKENAPTAEVVSLLAGVQFVPPKYLNTLRVSHTYLYVLTGISWQWTKRLMREGCDCYCSGSPNRDRRARGRARGEGSKGREKRIARALPGRTFQTSKRHDGHAKRPPSLPPHISEQITSYCRYLERVKDPHECMCFLEAYRRVNQTSSAIDFSSHILRLPGSCRATGEPKGHSRLSSGNNPGDRPALRNP